jgi:hypothetical protein
MPPSTSLNPHSALHNNQRLKPLLVMQNKALRGLEIPVRVGGLRITSDDFNRAVVDFK